MLRCILTRVTSNPNPKIYNETLRDLLVEDSPDLDLREDALGNSVVCGVHVVKIQSAEQVGGVCF